eukprot:scaffold97414_cov65-Phaeocystis_antarctica.AAC.2
MGGRVSPAAADGTPARVWHNFRGLAMARSIGDHNAKAVGVIAEPEVTHYTITKEDSMMILASDGVWEFLSSQVSRRRAALAAHNRAVVCCLVLPCAVACCLVLPCAALCRSVVVWALRRGRGGGTCATLLRAWRAAASPPSATSSCSRRRSDGRRRRATTATISPQSSSASPGSPVAVPDAPTLPDRAPLPRGWTLPTHALTSSESPPGWRATRGQPVQPRPRMFLCPAADHSTLSAADVAPCGGV